MKDSKRPARSQQGCSWQVSVIILLGWLELFGVFLLEEKGTVL